MRFSSGSFKRFKVTFTKTDNQICTAEACWKEIWKKPPLQACWVLTSPGTIFRIEKRGALLSNQEPISG
jgi:hypothetical protein